ncbi:MAG: hypothetical protein WDO14_11355 [Bacteroidota bacterium]
MATSEKSVLEFITRLTYNIDGISTSLKLYLSQFFTFHFSNSLSVDVIQNIENKKASRGYSNNDEIKSAVADFSLEQRAWCVAVIRLLRKEAEATAERKWLNRVDGIAKDLEVVFDLNDDLIQHQLSKIEEEITEYQNRRVVHVQLRIWPLALDFIIRTSVMLIFGALQLDLSMITALNISLIPAIVLLVTYVISRRDRKYNMLLLQSHGGLHKFRVQFGISVSQYTWLAFFLGTSVYVSYLLPDQIYTFAFTGLVLYFFILLRFFRVGRIDENAIEQLVESPGAREEYDYDRNDEEIVQLETKLNSFTSRLEAYVLESALFGALTFSGFLQIMASDLVNFTDLENFAQYIFNTSRGLMYFDPKIVNAGLTGLSNKVSLLCLVSLESLICSGFFLAVIASRLRFSDVADRVTTSLNVAKTYNAKEEAMLSDRGASERDPRRLAHLTAKVNEQLHIAALALETVNPIMTYMRYFRNGGIIVFLAILVSSSLFITSVLGWVFIALVGATYVYFNYSRLNLSMRAAYLATRIQFIRKSILFLVISNIPVVVSLILSGTKYWALASSLMALGYVTISLYIFTWLTLAAHVDEEFGDIESNTNVVRAGRWEFVKYTLAILILLYGIGMAFKELHLRGANETITITLTSLSILMYFVGYYLSKIRWLGVMCGVLLAITANGVLFKTLHLDGANTMLLIAIVGLIILIPVLIFKRSYFHRLFLRFTITIAILTISIASGLYYRIELVASHHTTDIAPIIDVQSSNFADKFEIEPSLIPEGLRKCDWYIETYGSIAYTGVFRDVTRNYYYYAQNQVELQKSNGVDKESLRNARILALKARQIYAMFFLEDELEDVDETIREIDELSR